MQRRGIAYDPRSPDYTGGRGLPLHVIVKPSPSIPEMDLYERSADHSRNVTTGATQLMPANKHRTAAFIVNFSSETIFLALGVDAAVGAGIPLNANGGAFEINKTNLWKGSISCIHGGAGNKVLCAVEIETRYAY